MNNTRNLWQNRNPKVLSIAWDIAWAKLPFYTKTTVVWRDITLHIRIDVHATEYGLSRLVTFLYDNKLYHCALGKYKGHGGSNGVHPPKISTLNHSLKIQTGLSGLSITEETINPMAERDGVSPFRIIQTPDDIVFDLPVVKKDPEPPKIKLDKGTVTLYENKMDNININSLAYFEMEKLVIDYWELGDKYEDERFVTIKNDQLTKLYKEFQIPDENKAELLIGLLNAFKGKESFKNIKTFLKQKDIKFDYNSRTD